MRSWRKKTSKRSFNKLKIYFVTRNVQTEVVQIQNINNGFIIKKIILFPLRNLRKKSEFRNATISG